MAALASLATDGGGARFAHLSSVRLWLGRLDGGTRFARKDPGENIPGLYQTDETWVFKAEKSLDLGSFQDDSDHNSGPFGPKNGKIGADSGNFETAVSRASRERIRRPGWCGIL